ncbi:MAG: hypothetical protein SNG45_07580 [Rikenellaceae bacterium]
MQNLQILFNVKLIPIRRDQSTPLYSSKPSRPAKLIHLMIGLLILKLLRNISDESVVGQIFG